MWKASAGKDINVDVSNEDDSWETDPDFINDVTEEEQRWGQSGRNIGSIDMRKLREETEKSDADKKKKQMEEGPNASRGYGGKFGVEKDRMDKCAVGHDHIEKLEKHTSQKDYSTGFGGKFGVQKDRVDKSAEGWEYKEKLEKHSSQKDYATGFGGKFGVQSDRVDKSAVGWDHMEKVEKHESQKDYSQGFGGKFGLQKDRMDKCAVGFQDAPDKIGTNYTKVKPEVLGTKPSVLRAKFEDMNIKTEETSKPAVRKQSDKAGDIVGKMQARIQSNESQSGMEKREIVTGRSSTISNAISSFNKPANENGSFVRKEPIKIERAQPEPEIEPVVEVEEPKPQQQQYQAPQTPEPVVSQTYEEPVQVITPPATHQEPIMKDPVALEQEQEQLMEQLKNNEMPSGVTSEEQYILSPDNPGICAMALYDYQASADDEISFDPNDIITHIEMIDEGWWRGLHQKSNMFGLFPANYVALSEQE